MYGITCMPVFGWFRLNALIMVQWYSNYCSIHNSTFITAIITYSNIKRKETNTKMEVMYDCQLSKYTSHNKDWNKICSHTVKLYISLKGMEGDLFWENTLQNLTSSLHCCIFKCTGMMLNFLMLLILSNKDFFCSFYNCKVYVWLHILFPNF